MKLNVINNTKDVSLFYLCPIVAGTLVGSLLLQVQWIRAITYATVLTISANFFFRYTCPTPLNAKNKQQPNNSKISFNATKTPSKTKNNHKPTKPQYPNEVPQEKSTQSFTPSNPVTPSTPQISKKKLVLTNHSVPRGKKEDDDLDAWFEKVDFAIQESKNNQSKISPCSTSYSPQEIPNLPIHQQWLYERDFVEADVINAIEANPKAVTKLNQRFPGIEVHEATIKYNNINKEWQKVLLVRFSYTAREWEIVRNLCKDDQDFDCLNPMLDAGPNTTRDSEIEKDMIYITIDHSKSNLIRSTDFNKKVRDLENYSCKIGKAKQPWNPKSHGNLQTNTPLEGMKGYLNHNQGICIGESHEEAVPKDFLSDSLSKLNINILFLEHLLYDHHQALLDQYFNEPEKGMPQELKGYLQTIRENSISYVTLVRKAIEEKRIRVVAIDTTVSYATGFTYNSGSKGNKRMASMNQTAAQIIKAHTAQGQKFVALVGSAHIGRYTENNLPDSSSIKGLAELVGCPAIWVKKGDKDRFIVNNKDWSYIPPGTTQKMQAIEACITLKASKN